MSEPMPALAEDVSRWDLPKVEGASLPRGSGGVNVMHLAAVERDAWEHGYKDGHVEGVRKGEAELRSRIAEVDVKLAALDAIEGPVDLEVFRRTMALELDADLGRVGRFGEGVFVGPVAMGIGLDLDVVIVLGLTEGTYPAPVRDESLRMYRLALPTDLFNGGWVLLLLRLRWN